MFMGELCSRTEPGCSKNGPTSMEAAGTGQETKTFFETQTRKLVLCWTSKWVLHTQFAAREGVIIDHNVILIFPLGRFY